MAAAPPSPGTLLLGPRLGPPRRSLRLRGLPPPARTAPQPPPQRVQVPPVPSPPPQEAPGPEERMPEAAQPKEEWKLTSTTEVESTVDLKQKFDELFPDSAFDVSTERWVRGNKTIYAHYKGCSPIVSIM